MNDHKEKRVSHNQVGKNNTLQYNDKINDNHKKY